MSAGDEPVPAPVPAAPPIELTQRMDEPLLPVEKKLIAGSLILGVLLLGFLLWLSNTFFPIARP